MYEYIKGKVTKKCANYIVVETNGIGYRLISSSKSIQNAQNDALFYTYLHVREDIFELYGFLSLEEREIFELLISVSGVGPKAAINILSAVSIDDFMLALSTQNSKILTMAQGVGPKVAQRIILELKGKVKGESLSADISSQDSSNLNDALEALTSLGYSSADALSVLKTAPQDMSVEDLVKYSLKNLLR